MSLIHEALKKVERQRLLGKAPTLDSPAFQHRRKGRWVLPALALAVVLASICLLWLWRTPAQPAAELARAAPETAATARAPTAGAPVSTAASRKPALEKPRPSPAAPPPKPAAAARPEAATQPAQEDTWIALPQAKPAAPTKVRSPAPKPTVAAPAPRRAQQPPVKTVPAPAPAVGKPLDQAGTPRPTANVPAAKPARPPTPAKPSSAPPMYWDLPYADRRDLPAFKISMHVFAPNPAKRFVILNGVRHIEGDALPGEITLISIRADGIVLEAEGKRFMVPRDGGY